MPDPAKVFAAEGFDLAAALKIIDASSMSDADKTLVKNALKNTADKPGLLPTVLTFAKSKLGL